MHTKTQSLYLAGIMLLAGLLVGGGLRTVRSETMQPATKEAEVGRYQLIPAGSSSNPYIYFLDTKTGRCWLESSPGSSWRLEGPLEVVPAPH